MFVIQLMKRRLMHVYAFRFCTSSFFTHDGCEYAENETIHFGYM